MRKISFIFIVFVSFISMAHFSEGQSITRTGPNGGLTIMPRNPLTEPDIDPPQMVWLGTQNETPRDLIPSETQTLGEKLVKKFHWQARAYRAATTNAAFLHLKPATVKNKEVVTITAALSWVDGKPLIPMIKLGGFQTALDEKGLNVLFDRLYRFKDGETDVHIDLQIERPSCQCIVLSRYDFTRHGSLRLLAKAAEQLD
jgi:hypothetical protein